MISIAAALALGAAAPTVTPSVTPARLPPVERCRGDPAIDRFRALLEDATTRRDVAALRRLVAPDVRASFGAEGSWEEFARTWGLEQNSAMSGLWKELARVMALGCAPSRAGGMIFPGLFEDRGEDADPFELVVARPGAKLQSRASENSAVVATLDWSSAILVRTEAPEGWARIQLLRGGPLGWVRRESLVSPLDYRLVAGKRDGRWLVTAFVAGD